MFQYVNEPELLQRGLVCKSTLRSRYGFNRALIDKYMPEPNTFRIVHGCKVDYWYITVLQDLKNNPEFVAAYLEKQELQPRYTKGVKKKTTNYVDALGDVQTVMQNVVVKEMPYATVVRRAIQATDVWKAGLVNLNQLDPRIKEQWTLNYVLHNLTVYDTVVSNLQSKTGKRKVLQEYTNSVLDKIAEVYPQLKSVCEKQKR